MNSLIAKQIESAHGMHSPSLECAACAAAPVRWDAFGIRDSDFRMNMATCCIRLWHFEKFENVSAIWIVPRLRNGVEKTIRSTSFALPFDRPSQTRPFNDFQMCVFSCVSNQNKSQLIRFDQWTDDHSKLRMQIEREIEMETNFTELFIRGRFRSHDATQYLLLYSWNLRVKSVGLCRRRDNGDAEAVQMYTLRFPFMGNVEAMNDNSTSLAASNAQGEENDVEERSLSTCPPRRETALSQGVRSKAYAYARNAL